MADQTQKRFYIIMGKPGSGKGTQAQLLKDILAQKGYEPLHVTTGGKFRELFTKNQSYLATKARELQDAGGLQPVFLAVWNWAEVFMETLKENTTVILDGAPRKLLEMEAMHEVFAFLGYPKPYVIYIDVSDAWARDRQVYRESHSDEKRADASSVEEIDKRLELFQKEIAPVIEHFKTDERYAYIHINGEQTIEEVHAEVAQKLNEVRH
jgi:adenylate kinase